MAELERSLTSERARAGVKGAQRRGVKFGRKVELRAEQSEHARRLIETGEGRQYVADLLNVGRLTFYPGLLEDNNAHECFPIRLLWNAVKIQRSWRKMAQDRD